MLETLGQYKILDRIGAGGIGEIYRARDTQLGRTVAIKLLTADVAADSELRERFLRDANATTVLSHPNIAALYEIGDDQGRVFLAFEFVPGETLNAVIAGRAINPRRAINLGIQIADALADAHAAGILHGDITPDNIIVTPKGNAKILDFGLSAWTGGGAQRRAAAAMTADSADTAARATVPYMSPEQALGEQVDERTDIFSLGTVLFEMLTGRLPFNASTSTALAMQIVQAAAPAPSTLNRALPRELDAIVGKALAKSLEGRYESAATLAAELRSVAAILDVRSAASEPGVVPFHTPRRSSWRWIVVALLLLAALAAAAWWQRTSIERVWRRSMGPAGRLRSVMIRAEGRPSRSAGGRPYVPFAGAPRQARRARISPRRSVNADRASTSSTPACRAALMTSTCTCEAKPMVGMAASAGSRFIAARVPSGSTRALLRSKITSDGALLRISTSAASDDRANVTGTPRWFAAVLILDVNIRSSRIAKITLASEPLH